MCVRFVIYIVLLTKYSSCETFGNDIVMYRQLFASSPVPYKLIHNSLKNFTLLKDTVSHKQTIQGCRNFGIHLNKSVSCNIYFIILSFTIKYLSYLENQPISQRICGGLFPDKAFRLK